MARRVSGGGGGGDLRARGDFASCEGGADFLEGAGADFFVTFLTEVSARVAFFVSGFFGLLSFFMEGGVSACVNSKIPPGLPRFACLTKRPGSSA